MMHRGGWAHRDIKLENTVIDKHGGLRLADFGMSIKGARGRNLAGTKSYMPPATTDRHFRMVVQGSWDNFWRAHKRSGLDKATSDQPSTEFRQLIQGMLAINPTDRFDMEQVARSEFLSGEHTTNLSIEIESAECTAASREASHEIADLDHFSDLHLDPIEFLKCSQLELDILTKEIVKRTDI